MHDVEELKRMGFMKKVLHTDKMNDDINNIPFIGDTEQQTRDVYLTNILSHNKRYDHNDDIW
ncbi:hypothetical protein T01_6396 [Trichinella spiralis]|uniref:Uncharacterized protein n=1 Tax=Trichinella spiralis TaxID=6334 RepID=A0A0V1B5J8_TRISP|nr:hypothetical protein T01_6396 [Trichinella spiralis]